MTIQHSHSHSHRFTHRIYQRRKNRIFLNHPNVKIFLNYILFLSVHSLSIPFVISCFVMNLFCFFGAFFRVQLRCSDDKCSHWKTTTITSPTTNSKFVKFGDTQSLDAFFLFFGSFFSTNFIFGVAFYFIWCLCYDSFFFRFVERTKIAWWLDWQQIRGS